MKDSKVLIHIPHSSSYIPQIMQSRVLIDNDKLKRELLNMTDLYADDLFENSNFNIIKAPFSRLFCDVEKYRDDEKEQMAKYGMGTIYTHTSYGEKLIDYNSEYKNSILKNYYDEYHKLFDTCVDLILKKFKECIIIDAHSFSEKVVKRMFNKDASSVDICIGYNEDYNVNLLNSTKKFFESKGYNCACNYPYSGSIIPQKYLSSKNDKLKSIMIEINKKVYVDEETGEKKQDYFRLKQDIQEYLFNIERQELSLGVKPQGTVWEK